MEAKETAMSMDEMRLLCSKAYKDATGELVAPYHIDMTCPPILCQAQAEISFKAGVKEVVEWIKEHGYISLDNPNEWQAKLKEWEIGGS